MHQLDPYRAATLLIRQLGADAAEDYARGRQLMLWEIYRDDRNKGLV